MLTQRKRTLRGYILPAALIFALVMGIAPIPVAMAAGVSVDGTELTVVGNRITVPLIIAPVTPLPHGGTVDLTVVLRRSGIEIKTILDNIADFVYGQTSVNVAVYDVPSGYGPTAQVGNVTHSVYGNQVSVTVYLDEIIVTPPTEPEEPSLPSGTTGTDTGWQTYDEENDEVELFVDPDKTGDLFAEAPEEGVTLIDVKPPAGATEAPANVVANIPPQVLAQAGQSTVDSVLRLGSVELAVSPQVMETLRDAVVQAAGSFANLELRATRSDEAATEEVLEGTGEDLQLMTPASEVVTLSFWAVGPDGRETQMDLAEILVGIPFDFGSVGNSDHVNLYRIGSLIFVGGKVVDGKVVGVVKDFREGQFVALEYSKTFEDIVGHWGQGDIELMASKYVVKGVSDTEFEPERAINRAEFLAMLTRSLGVPEKVGGSATFTDVAPGSWYFGNVEAAFAIGLAKGDGGAGSTFRPEAPISREEMSALMVRAMKIAEDEAKALTEAEVEAILGEFIDNESVSTWATYEVAQAVNEGIVKGPGAGLLDPSSDGKRAESATMMSRFMKMVGVL